MSEEGSEGIGLSLGRAVRLRRWEGWAEGEGVQRRECGTGTGIPVPTYEGEPVSPTSPRGRGGYGGGEVGEVGMVVVMAPLGGRRAGVSANSLGR